MPHSYTRKIPARNPEKNPEFHRLLPIINRNVTGKSTMMDIKRAFRNEPYEQKSAKSRMIIDRFFKECDRDDLDALIVLDGITVESVRSVYLDAPASGSFGTQGWHDVLNIKASQKHVKSVVVPRPRARSIDKIMKMRASDV